MFSIVIPTYNNLKYLENFIGTKSFKLSITELFNNSSDNISEIFQKHSKQNLEWFFNDLINEDKNLEYKIIKENYVHKKDNKSYL